MLYSHYKQFIVIKLNQVKLIHKRVMYVEDNNFYMKIKQYNNIGHYCYIVLIQIIFSSETRISTFFQLSATLNFNIRLHTRTFSLKFDARHI